MVNVNISLLRRNTVTNAFLKEKCNCINVILKKFIQVLLSKCIPNFACKVKSYSVLIFLAYVSTINIGQLIFETIPNVKNRCISFYVYLSSMCYGKKKAIYIYNVLSVKHKSILYIVYTIPYCRHFM